MSSNLKTALTAGTIALAVTIFAVGSAHAGGRHHLPFAPYGYSAYDDHDSYGCEDCNDDYGYGYGSKADSALSTARRVTRDMLGVDIGDVVDEIAD